MKCVPNSRQRLQDVTVRGGKVSYGAVGSTVLPYVKCTQNFTGLSLSELQSVPLRLSLCVMLS